MFWQVRLEERAKEDERTNLCNAFFRFFVPLSGLAYITLPDGSDEAWIVEGVNGLAVAADTTGLGHHTAYPSDKETVALQIPFADGIVPHHRVLKGGACHSASQVISHDSSTTLVANEL